MPFEKFGENMNCPQKKFSIDEIPERHFLVANHVV
jgi:hypothetical protein